MEWNHGIMESWNGMKSWNHGMESCKIGGLHDKIRTSGLEPESHPWKGGVLPLYYVR